jgi:chromosome segregation ATPase
MQNLVYLILMAVAGGAGWYIGSWKGRDAIEAVAQYQKIGDEAQAALTQAKTQLAADLAAKDAKFDAELKQLTETHTRQLQGYDAKLAGNQAEIARLSKVSSAGQTRIAELTKQRDAAATPQQRAALDTQLQAAVAEQKAVQVEIDGRQCMPVPVPLAFLADWKAAGAEVKP